MKLRDIDVKYVTFFIVGTDGKTYLCMPHCALIYALIWLWPKRQVKAKDKVWAMTAFGWREK